MELSNGTLLQGGKYKIERKLGQGGFGITYLAEQTMLERKVCIKEFFMKEICLREGSTSHVTLGTEGARVTLEKFRDKFLKEARNIAKLDHPNIVRIIDVFEENGTAYYVMKYAEGGSLAKLLDSKKYLSEEIATKHILEVASALKYVHQKRINHLDIKPANIMLTDDGHCVLIDFGLSKQYDAGGRQTSTTPVGISEGYAPMEQYTGTISEFSPETDIYSLGATFFKLLTGERPPIASEIYENGVPVNKLQLKNISQSAIDVICKAMESRKRDRIHDIQDFIDALAVEQESTEDDESTQMINDAAIEAERAQLRMAVAEAEAKRKEAERKQQEAERRQQEAEQNATDTSGNGSSKKILSIIVAIIVIASVIGYSVTRPKPHNVEEMTIVLTQGAANLRNYVYTGHVDENDLPNGLGTAKYPETKSSSASTFVGIFINGLPHKGTQTFASGIKFEGEYSTGGEYKSGKLTDKEGYYFKGEFSNGAPYNGKWYSPNGTIDSYVTYGK